MRPKIVPYNPKLKAKAKELRKNMTLSEIILWNELKKKQIKGYDFDRQRPIDNFIVDFYCKDLMLAIEIDGESHVGKEEYDTLRDERLRNFGIHVLHFDDLEVRQNLGGVIMKIESWMEKNEPTPRPSKEGTGTQTFGNLSLILLLIMITSITLHAEGNGGFAGAFLRVGLGARALAMGNAQVANPENGYGGYYNPAGMPYLPKKTFSISYSAMSLDRRFNYIGLATPLKPFAGVSAGWIHSGVRDIRAYDSRGEDVGSIDHGLHAIYLSFGFKILAMLQQSGQFKGLPSDLISIGISMKYLREGLDDNDEFKYTGKGFGIDLGVLVKPHTKFAIGYQLKDLNSKLESNTNDIFERGSTLQNKFPVTQKLGIFYDTPLDWASVAYDFEWSDAGEEKHHFGAELVSKIASGRLGYDNNHFTFGGGLEFKMVKRLYMVLDYAFLDDVEDEGISHVFSWQFLF